MGGDHIRRQGQTLSLVEGDRDRRQEPHRGQDLPPCGGQRLHFLGGHGVPEPDLLALQVSRLDL